MGSQKIKSNFRLFTFLFIALLSSLYIISYNIFNSYFTDIENSENKKAINYFIKNIEQSIIGLKNITYDYSNWDKTYDFLDGNNDEFIFNNFRYGTKTLNELGLDFIFFTDKTNKIFFSKYTDTFDKDKSKLENTFFKTLKNKKDAKTIISIDSHYFIVIKNPVYESTRNDESNGYIYSGKKFDLEYIKTITSSYKKINFVKKRIIGETSLYKKILSKNVKYGIKYTPYSIINSIEINDINDNYLFTIEAIVGRDIIKNGKHILILFNIIITLLLSVVFYLVIRYEKMVLRQKHELDNQIEEKTYKLNNALEKLEIKNKELYQLAHIDVLTKINNRRSFFHLTKQAITNIIKQKQELCIVMIDIDKFKYINDTYGHKTGDIVLLNFCKSINNLIDEKSIFGRLGGEEFAITFSNKSIFEVEIIAEKIRKKIENSVLEINGESIKYTISLGISSYEKSSTIDDILNQADELLYQAKKSGRNKVIRKI